MNATPKGPSLQNAYLKATDGSAYAVSPGETVVGRDSSCEVQLQDPSVSKKHCVIRGSEEGFAVTDLGSTNHTFVNHVCLREGQSSPLSDGDRLMLGRSTLTFFSPARATSNATTSGGARETPRHRPPSESTIVSFELSTPGRPISEESFSEGTFRELRKANERLSVFYDFGRQVGNLLDIDQLLRTVAHRIMNLVPADTGVILLRHPGGYRPRLCWRSGAFHDCVEATYSSTAVAKAIAERRGLVIQDVSTRPDLRAAQSIRELNIKSTMVVPIVLEDEVFGALCLSACGHRTDFGPDDFAMVSGIAGQIAVSVKNAELADRIRLTTAEKERLQKEIEIAAHVQSSILPVVPPSLPGLDIAGVSFPAREVGGDFFDYVPFGQDALGMTIADVSGKGLAAALLTLQSKNIIHAFAKENLGPAQVLSKANIVLYDDYSRAGMFLSAFYATLNLPMKTLHYASAGHNPPLLRRADGTCLHLEATGSLLGISHDFVIEEQTVQLEDNDVLVLYTDGISESRDGNGVQFGCERLAQKLGDCCHLPAQEIARQVIEEVRSFAGPNPFDDATLVIVKPTSCQSDR